MHHNSAIELSQVLSFIQAQHKNSRYRGPHLGKLTATSAEIVEGHFPTFTLAYAC